MRGDRPKVYDGGHGALVVSLTKFFKRMRIKRGKRLFAEIHGNCIILSEFPILTNSTKPDMISEEVWNSFEWVLVKVHGRDIIENEKKIKENLDKALLDWIHKTDKWYNKVILKV